MSADLSRTDDDRTRRQELSARHWRSVTELFEHRTDLVGVHPLADLIHDSVRWSA